MRGLKTAIANTEGGPAHGPCDRRSRRLAGRIGPPPWPEAGRRRQSTSICRRAHRQGDLGRARPPPGFDLSHRNRAAGRNDDGGTWSRVRARVRGPSGITSTQTSAQHESRPLAAHVAAGRKAGRRSPPKAAPNAAALLPLPAARDRGARGRRHAARRPARRGQDRGRDRVRPADRRAADLGRLPARSRPACGWPRSRAGGPRRALSCCATWSLAPP